MREALTATALDLPLLRRGKVRDVYDLGTELLIVTTDRLSAFDVVLPTPIPDKGRVLNAMSNFWFEKLAHIVPNHLITADVARYPAALRKYAAELEGRYERERRPWPALALTTNTSGTVVTNTILAGDADPNADQDNDGLNPNGHVISRSADDERTKECSVSAAMCDAR